MGNIRPETYYSSGYVIEALDRNGTIAEMLHDGGDIVLFKTHTDQQVSMHLIESGIPLYEIRNIINDNNDKGIYTLFMLWCSMMVPNDGQLYRVDDWMDAFIALNGDHIYAYDVFDGDIFVFPVFFRNYNNSPNLFTVEYGTTTHVGNLILTQPQVKRPDFTGKWRVARFGVPRYTTEDAFKNAVPMSKLAQCYALLGVDEQDSVDIIKRAYRLLARRYHPDYNSDSDAVDKMQQINEAYQYILNQRNS